MSQDESPPPNRQPHTIGSVVVVLLVVLILLLIGEIAGVGLQAWLDWWKRLP
jgi:hypothetical protein